MIESEVVAHFVGNRNIRANDTAHTPLQKKTNNNNALDPLHKIWIRAAHSSARIFLPNDSIEAFIPTKVLMNILALKIIFIFRRDFFFVITGYNLQLIGKW